MLQKTNIAYHGVPLEIMYSYTPPNEGDYYEPPTSGHVEIDSIFVVDSEIDIFDLISSEMRNIMQEKIFFDIYSCDE